MPTVRHTRRPPTKTAKAQAAPKPTRAPSTPKKAPKPAKPTTAKAASSRPSRAPTKKPVRRSNTKAATAAKPPVKAAKPPAKPTRFWRALGLSAAGVAAAAGLYAAYRKRGTLMAAVQPVLQRMTPAEKARFVKECNAKGVKGKTAKGVVKGVDKGRGKAGYVSAVVVAVVALVGVAAYVWRRINTNDEQLQNPTLLNPENNGGHRPGLLPPTQIEDEYSQEHIAKGETICKQRFRLNAPFNTDSNKKKVCKRLTLKLRKQNIYGHCKYVHPITDSCTYVPPTDEERMRRMLAEHFDKRTENEMIQWKRENEGGTFTQYIASFYPENITYNDEGEAVLDPRLNGRRWRGAFNRVKPDDSLHII